MMFDRFEEKITKDFNYTNKEAKRIRYILTALLSDGSKILLTGIFFLVIGKFLEFVVAVVVLMLVRTDSGGLHFKHYISCFLFSFIILYLSVIILPSYVTISKTAILSTLIVCAVIICFIKPVLAVGRPAVTLDSTLQFRFSTWKHIFLYFLITYISDVNYYLLVGYWTVILQLSQLIIANIIRKEKHT